MRWDSSMADSDAQLIADMEAQIELFDFISAAETFKKMGECWTMSKLSDRIIQVLIRKDVSIHAQLFRFMSLLGTIAMQWGEFIRLPRDGDKKCRSIYCRGAFYGHAFSGRKIKFQAI